MLFVGDFETEFRLISCKMYRQVNLCYLIRGELLLFYQENLDHNLPGLISYAVVCCHFLL